MEKLNLNRKIGLDVLKCIAAFLVVCIHASFYDKFGDYFTAISRMAVPIFFIITGYFYTRTVVHYSQNRYSVFFFHHQDELFSRPFEIFQI